MIHVSDLADPRLAEYRDLKESQLARAFDAPGELTPQAGEGSPHGRLMAEGEVVFNVLVNSPHRVLSVLCTPTRARTIDAALRTLPEQTPVYLIEPQHLESLVGFPLHRGLMAIAARARPVAASDLLAHPDPARPLLVLEHIVNHDNIGGLYRSAAAFNARGILLSPRCADPLYRKAIRVSVGHALRVPTARLGPWPDGLSLVRDAGYLLVALSGRDHSTDLPTLAQALAQNPRPIALLLGTEGPGLSEEAIAMADQCVRIPMAPGVDSLNVMVAGTIALWELAGRHRAPEPPSTPYP